MTSSPTIGVSACLVGRAVRYDGGHRRDDFVVDRLARRARIVPVCPEVELGLGTPRPTLQLTRIDGAVRLIETGGRDLTAAMAQYAAARLEELAAEDFDGYVFKARSPSCAVRDARIIESADGATAGAGLFAAALVARDPSLPVEDEVRLSSPAAQRDFVERVGAYRRVKQLFRTRWTRGDLVSFHTAHKFVLFARDEAAYRALGRFVAAIDTVDRADVPARYTSALMAALAAPTSTGGHTNVLMHALGHFRGRIDDAARDALATTVHRYRDGIATLDAAIAAIAAQARTRGIDYLTGQIYFADDPFD